ncbi:hypothetical protein Y032_0006g2866 [Ancylostoma ceylanicum]|nr:hypothetical protein Y032_0006g2866 [Ancylostoma ceylanicum]
MRPRRHSMDSETSSDSWSVIQKNVELREHSDDEIEFEPSDSEQWDSDSDQETHDGGKSDDEGNDSLEECDESQCTDDDAGDCEIVEEDEANEVNGCRYYIPSEKISKCLDQLDAECCSSFDALLRWVFPSTRDATRVVVLLFFVLSTAILFAKSSRLGEVHGDRSSEVFASGLQSREDFERAFAPSLRLRSRFNFSETCNRWQMSVWKATPSWPARQPVTNPPLFFPAILNSTPEFEINEAAFFSRPAVKISPISISHYAKVFNHIPFLFEFSKNSFCGLCKQRSNADRLRHLCGSRTFFVRH